MNYSPSNFEIMRRDVHRIVELKIVALGIYSRIFSRIKDPASVSKKLADKAVLYAETGKKMQDFLGIRVTVYFEDDISIVAKALRGAFQFDSESVDVPNHEKFSPRRHNIVFRMPSKLFERNPSTNHIDDTFEVQIRTIFSEGWHEIEHDLRYKNKARWDKQPLESRGLNAILASLEMCDWGIAKLTDDMAYASYKDGDLLSLVVNKFRLRIASHGINDFFTNACKEPDFLKRIFRSKRDALLLILAETGGQIPINVNNILWVLAKTQSIIEFDEFAFPSPIKDILVEHGLW